MSDLAFPVGADDTSDLLDTRYYQAAAPGSLGERVLITARHRIFQDFMRLCAPRPGDQILDVGVSDVVTDGANLLERLYPHPEDLTAAGLGGGGRFQAAYPKVRYHKIEPVRGLPYDNRVFPIAASNAVLEHVGSAAAQAEFVHELARVADRIFITVPNRFFPIEHHTAIPLAHWTARTFRMACTALGRTEWLDEKNLILMDRRNLERLAPPHCRQSVRIGWTGLRFGPFSSNLYMFIDQTTCRR